MTLDDSREYEDEDPREKAQQPDERVRNPVEKKQSQGRRHRRNTLPAFLSIPKCMPAAACFYLTDGEGLSDSELLDDEEEAEFADERDEAP